MSDIALSVHSLSKSYQLGHSSREGVREGLTNYGQRLFGGNKNAASEGSFWALKDVSFELKKGEALGVFGRNGCGKSTLLKILSEVTPPTEGSVDIYGKVASVLDIGMGFHPDLTGRENVFYCGSIMGMSRDELTKSLDSIIEFSEIGEFIDSPVKHYSSGMYMRLAFSLVSHISADILIFDEVFSVGDAAFKIKTLKKIKDLAKQDKTIIMVTHNLGEITSICNRAIVLEHGMVKAEGAPDELIADYAEEVFQSIQDESSSDLNGASTEQNETSTSIKIWKDLTDAPGNKNAKITKIQVTGHQKKVDEDIYMSDGIEVAITCKKMDRQSKFDVGFTLYDHVDNNVFAATTVISGNNADTKIDADFTATCHIPANTLNAGTFTMNVFLVENEKDIFRSLPGVILFRINMNSNEEKEPWGKSFPGPLRPLYNWDIASTK